MTRDQEKKQLTETDPQMTQMLESESALQGLSRAVRNMFKNLEKIRVVMSEQMKKVSREKEIMKKKNGNSATEKKISVIKNLLDWLKSIFKVSRERANEPETNS